MRKGAIFTIEASYSLLAVFVAIVALFSFMQLVEQPNYDLINELKVAHDMGEANVSAAPDGFAFGPACASADSFATLQHYDYGGSYPEPINGVCMSP